MFGIILGILLSIVLLFTPFTAFADENFDISTFAKYEVGENGDTQVIQTITIKNKTEFTYTPSYAISTGIKDIRNLKSSNADGPIDDVLKENGDGSTIEVTFPRRVVGLGNENRFTVSFTTKEIAKESGNVWEVSIPGLSNPDAFASYDVQVVVPSSFGPPEIVKPYKKFNPVQQYSFTKNEMGKAGVFMIFGSEQIYVFDLTYNISNPRVVPVKTEIALPPPTSYQDVRIKSISPAPESMYEDNDGNWLAVYSLGPREVKTVKAVVAVKVFSGPIFEKGNPNDEDLAGVRYWEVSDPTIKSKAQELKTPENIYNFVVDTLSYNYDKVADENVRLGAKQAIQRPDFAVCLEFTDLFVALARAAGIKARSVEGYAHTENSKLRPLSLVNDVLHSWPEYYDEDLKTWIMVDPTWGNTTGGMDYFNTLDYDHVAFVVKGKDSTYPVPAGGYKVNGNSKDVNVKISSEADFESIAKSSLETDFPENALSGFPIEGKIIIKNEGNVPIENKKLIIESDLTPNHQEFLIEKLLPYENKEIVVAFDKVPFLTRGTFKAKISFDGTNLTQEISVGLFPDYYWFVLGGVLFFGSTIIAIIAYKTWSIYLSKPKK